MSKEGPTVLERKIRLTNKVGLHARPAAQFVIAAAKFKCTIKVVKYGIEAEAKSITSILFLDARRGDEITVRAEGEDAKDALESLIEVVRKF